MSTENDNMMDRPSMQASAFVGLAQGAANDREKIALMLAALNAMVDASDEVHDRLDALEGQ